MTLITIPMDRLTSRTFLLYLLFTLFIGAKGQQSLCENGWFGEKCQYKCRCLDGAVCDKTTGDCPGDCAGRWFGPQCQYYDAAYRLGNRQLVDGYLSTCLAGDDLYQYVPLLRDIMFTWMRIVTNKPGLFEKVKITFYLRYGTEVNPKSALTYILVNATILELHGKLQNRLRGIGLEFDTPETRQSFCAMQVSQGRNVAIKQHAFQSTTEQNYVAEKAIHGTFNPYWSQGLCASTQLEDSSYWALNLSMPVTVNMYTLLGIYDRPATCPLHYFRLESYYQSTKVQQYDETKLRYIYFVDAVNTSLITSVTLTVSKDFWPVNSDGWENGTIRIILCEMEIFGDVVCPQGKWGRDCEKDCNCQDSSESCFVSTGMCPSGCKAGFQGFGCQEESDTKFYGDITVPNRLATSVKINCVITSLVLVTTALMENSFQTTALRGKCSLGFFGPNCTKQCSEHCGGDGLCSNIDGRCLNGCKPGYTSDNCEQECNPGYYGEGCAQQCSDKCKDQLCHHTIGLCYDCPDGFQLSEDCLKECDPGFYGYNCFQNCPKICLNNMCDNVEGSCDKCPAGYQGPLCDRECADGQWGISCLNNCGKCLNGKCNTVSGECLSGCVQGYKMPFCVEECDLGFHGYNCIDSCPKNCRNKTCNKVDGLCIECEAGYQGPLCAQVCDATFYGQNCATPCSDKCLDQLCHHITGLCQKCPYGKQISKDCSQDCDAGFHGYKCVQPCPVNCQDKICDNADGTCTKCVEGYQGLVCNQECDDTFYGEDCATQCSDRCINQLCHHITGVCENCPEGKQISKDCSQDADQLNLAIILVPVILVLIVVAALIFGIWLWRKRNAQKTNSRTVFNNENKDRPDVVLGHGVNLELEDTQPPNAPEATIDHYDRISLNVNEGNPDNNENENTSRYVNVENPALNEYERTGENRESHVYTEPED